MKNKFIITSLIFSFLLFLPFSLQVNAESYGDIYNEKERLLSIKESADYLLLIVGESEDLKVALESIISATENIENRIENRMEEDFSDEGDFIENLENTLNLNSFSSEVKFNFEGEEVYDDDTLGAIIHLNVESDNKVDKANEKIETDLDLGFLFYDDYLEEQHQGSLSIILTIIEESVFVRLNDFKFETENDEANFVYLFLVKSIVEEVKNRDILLDELLEEALEQLEEEGMSDDLDISSEEAEEIVRGVMLSAFNRGLFKMEGVETEYVNGERMKKHSFSIDFQKIPYFLEDTLWYIQKFDDNFSDQDVEDAIEEARREIEGVDVRAKLTEAGITYDLTFDVWTDGDYVRKIEFYLDEKLEEYYSEISMIFDFSIFIDDLNRNLGIEAPDNYTGIYELLEEYGYTEGLEF